MEFRNFQTLVQAWAHGDSDGQAPPPSAHDGVMLAPRTLIRTHPCDGPDALFVLIFRQHVLEIALNAAAQRLWGYSLAEMRRYAAVFDDLVSADASDQARRYAPFWMHLFAPASIGTFAVLALAWSYEQCTEATFDCQIVRRNGQTPHVHVLFRRTGPCSCILKIRERPWPDAPRLRILDELRPDAFYGARFAPMSSPSTADQILSDSVIQVVLFGFQIFSPFDVTEFARHPNVAQAYRQLELVLLPAQIESFRSNVARASLRAGFQRVPRANAPVRRMGHDDKERIMLEFLAELGIRPAARPAILIVTAVQLDNAATKYTPWINDVAQELWHLTVEDLWTAFDAMDRPRVDPDSGVKLAPIMLLLFHRRSWPILAAIWNELWFRCDGVFAAPLEIQRLWCGSSIPMLAYGCLMASPLSANGHDSVGVALCPLTDAECSELFNLQISLK